MGRCAKPERWLLLVQGAECGSPVLVEAAVVFDCWRNDFKHAVASSPRELNHDLTQKEFLHHQNLARKLRLSKCGNYSRSYRNNIARMPIQAAHTRILSRGRGRRAPPKTPLRARGRRAPPNPLIMSSPK